MPQHRGRRDRLDTRALPGLGEADPDARFRGIGTGGTSPSAASVRVQDPSSVVVRVASVWLKRDRGPRSIQPPTSPRMVSMRHRPTRPSPASRVRLTPALAALVLLLALGVAGSGTISRAAGPSAVPLPGPWAVAGEDVRVETPDRVFDALVRWPAADDATADAGPRGTGPWPVVIFGHGFLAAPDLYVETLRELASWGFIVVAPRSGGELFPDHAAFAADLSAVIDWLTAENGRAGSPFAGAVDLAHIGVSGHSMGGGASLLAAAADPRIQTVANLAAAETRPSAIEAAGAITVPTLLIAGELDAIAPLAQHQRPMYDALTGAPSQLRIILGGSHCGFTDPVSDDPLAGLASLVCDTGTIPGESQRALASQLLADWFRLHLAGADVLREHVWDPAPDDGTTVEQRLP